MSDDLKYVLLPTIENRRRTPKFQPWYRERLKTKYPCRMDTKNWKFVKDGLDDFRDGLPPSHDDIMLEPDKGLSPVVLSQSPTRRVKENVSNIRHRLKDHQIYLSRELPTAEKRRQLIDHYIGTILDHPMAFFTHFNKTLEPDMYERITKLLEAELLRIMGDEQNLSTEEYRENLSISTSMPNTRPETSITVKTLSEHSIPSNTQPPQPPPLVQEESSETKSSLILSGRNAIVYDEYGNPWDAEEFEKKQKNPYRWFIEKQEEKQKARDQTQDEMATSAMEARLRDVAEQFCNWLHDLGGEKNIDDIDPAVVRNLFSTAYDTKPPLSVPIKIVEMTRIPLDLREGVQESMIAGSEYTKSTLPEITNPLKSTKLPTFRSGQDEQSPRKYRYGAWYLPKNLWRRSLVKEELRDPKAIKAELEDEARQREEQINARLAPLHGIDAFKEYLVEKNVSRLPKLITDVQKYRLDHPREISNSLGDFQSKSLGEFQSKSIS